MSVNENNPGQQPSQSTPSGSGSSGEAAADAMIELATAVKDGINSVKAKAEAAVKQGAKTAIQAAGAAEGIPPSVSGAAFDAVADGSQKPSAGSQSQGAPDADQAADIAKKAGMGMGV